MSDTAAPSARLITEELNGLKTLWLETAEGKKLVHSRFDPVKEATRIAGQLRLQKNDLVVVVGGGQGYLPRVLSELPLALQVIVVEPDREVADALDVRPQKSGTEEIIVEGDSARLTERITRRQKQHRFCDVVLYINPAYAIAFNRFVRQLTRSFQPGRNRSLLKKRASTHTVAGIRKVLLLDTGYFLQRELSKALSELELKQASVKVAQHSYRISPGGREGRYEAAADFLPRLLEAVASFRPDLLLTVNHLGFDREGKLTALLEELNLPVAVWYVDSPTYILNGKMKGVSQSHHLFVWERSYLSELDDNGFQYATHLPLAAGHHMKPGRGGRLQQGAFVGGSNSAGIRVWQQKAHLNLTQRRREELIAAQRANPATGVSQLLQELKLDGNSELLRRNSESLLVLQATQRERVELLRRVPVDVYGDPEWLQLLPQGRKISPTVDYYEGLPALYQRYAVQLNQTSYQMNRAVNQRVFDVPLCGGLLLTDYREDLEQLFNIKQECALYHDHEEAADKLDWFLTHPGEAEKVTAAAARRIRGEHLYKHRLRTMMKILNSRLREKE